MSFAEELPAHIFACAVEYLEKPRDTYLSSLRQDHRQMSEQGEHDPRAIQAARTETYEPEHLTAVTPSCRALVYWGRKAASRAALHRAETTPLAVVRHPRMLP